MQYQAQWRQVLLFALFCFVVNCCYSQKSELRANAYSGFFFFRGSGSASVTNIGTSGPADEPGLFNSYPYGRKSGFSYAFELQAQRLTRRRHLVGAGISFENVKSSLNIDSIGTQMGRIDVDGTAVLSNHFITVNPYIGQRLIATTFTLDVLAGADISFSAKVYEEANVTTGEQNKYTYNKTHKTYPADLRPRIQLNAYYKRIGLLAGYSFGTQNLHFRKEHGYDYLNRKAYTNFLRFGLSYKLRQF